MRVTNRSAKKREHSRTTEELETFRTKLQPSYLRFAEIYRDAVRELKEIQKLGLSRERLNEATGNLGRKITEQMIRELAPITPADLPDLAGSDAFYNAAFEILESEDATRAHEIAILEFDAENRYHQPFLSIAKSHANGDKHATAKFYRLLLDRENVRYGCGLPGFKGNIDHRILMSCGLGSGLENLSAEELAAFYDEFCPCRVDGHDSDDLRKLRKRILDDGRRARDSMTAQLTSPNHKVL